MIMIETLYFDCPWNAQFLFALGLETKQLKNESKRSLTLFYSLKYWKFHYLISLANVSNKYLNITIVFAIVAFFSMTQVRMHFIV